MTQVNTLNPVRGNRRNRSSVRRGQLKFVAFCIIPAVAFFLVFRFYPVGQAFWMSLHDWRLIGSNRTFVGTQNYQEILTDPLFRKILQNTLYFAAATSIGLTISALAVAILLNPIRRGSTIFQLVYFLPVMTSTIAISTIWLWLYQPQFGLINQLLRAINMPPGTWLTSPSTAMPSIILMSVWGGLGFYVIIFLAGLRNIPAMYYEAAAIDGASRYQAIRYITIPLLRPVITFVLVTSVIGSFNVFQQVYLMTGGGPLNSTRVLALHIYNTAFRNLEIGKAASMAFVMFAVVLALTLLQMWLRKADNDT